MKDVNKVILLGRLGADPVLRYTKNQIPVSHFSIATTRKFYREDSESSQTGSAPIEETQWHKVVAWGKKGSMCSQYLKKGSHVYLEGQIRSHSYQGKDGQSKMSFEIYLDDISFLSSKKTNGSEGGSIEFAPSGGSYDSPGSSTEDLMPADTTDSIFGEMQEAQMS